MKSEEFIRMLNGIDSGLIEKASEDMAVWTEAQNGVSVSAGSPRRTSLWIAAASVACAAAVVVGAFFISRNIRQNRALGIADGSESSSVQENVGGNGVPVSSGGSESVSVTNNDPPVTPADDQGTMFEAVDPVDDRITYEWAVKPDKITYRKKSLEYSYDFDHNTIALRYLKEFFGNDNTPVSSQYAGNWQRWICTGMFSCDVDSGTGVYAPAAGRVITASMYQGQMGNSIAVEMPEGKIFVLYHLDEIHVKVGDTVTAGQQLGVCGSTGSVMAGETKLEMVIMKKTGPLSEDKLEQTFSRDFDGLVLTVTTNKTAYNAGDLIHLHASLENTTDKDIYLRCNVTPYGYNDAINPYFEDLIEHPVNKEAVGDIMTPTVIRINPGLHGSKELIFQTLTDLGGAGGELSPDYVTDAAPGAHYGKFTVTAENADGSISEYTLGFYVTINPQNSEIAPDPDDSSVIDHDFTEHPTDTRYTEGMLKDYFICDRVLYTNCYTCPVDWVTDNDRYGYNFDFGKVGGLVTTISGRADLEKFGDSTANVLPDGTEIYTFPDNGELLIARSGDEYIPYMGIREG